MILPRDQDANKALGEKSLQRLKNSKVLLVGAGGIGCELLKDLVLLGVGEIHVVDLDTIDLSNLNRQFLFGREHIKKAKAVVAKETASKFNPYVNIVSYQANICDKEFNVKWFRGFNVVYNALDNLEARRHVNRMCLVSDVPLVESGTAGFNGQVQVILPGKTECYDCYPKPVPKTFAVCTIRSTPSQPVHCVVWAKNYLFSQLFDENNEENDVEEEGEGEDEEELKKLKSERNELKELKGKILEEGFFEQMFKKVFGVDIERLLMMDSMWKTRKPPILLKYDELERGSDSADVIKNDQKIWTLNENFHVLKDSLRRLQKRLKEEKTLSFDKDDIDTLNFVSSAANIRSYIFSIPLKSEFDIKQIAGNIIPAIATTNAIIAGICVLQSLLIFDGQVEECKNVFLSRLPEYLVQSIRLSPPNPHCVVSGIARTVVKTDPSKSTLGELIDSLLKLELGYSEELSVVTDQLLYDPDYDDNLSSTLADLKITDGSFITIIDEDDDGRVNLELYIESGEDKGFILKEKPVIGLKVKKEEEEEDVDGDINVGDGDITNNKRKPDELLDNSTSKKLKVEPATDEIILIDDDEAIEIFD